jgi:hypothetical protein
MEQEGNMSKEKHIEEMCVIAKQALDENRGWRCKCDICCEDIIDGIYCDESSVINGLYNAGYRKQEWISVNERLPEPLKLVLCIWERVYDGWNYGFARYQRDDVWYVSNEGMPRVTHWMPLPAPPKGE